MKKDEFKLNQENYHSREANLLYMSNSQFKNIMKCPASVMAELDGRYNFFPTDSMLVGSYVDAYFEGSLELFKENNPSIFTQKGTLKAQYKHADKIIKKIENDRKMIFYLSGEKQVILTGQIQGVDTKIKMDSYMKGKFIADLKVMRDFNPLWRHSVKLNFIEFWGYDFQGAFYQRTEGNRLPFYLVCATKETEPDLLIVQIPQSRLDACNKVIDERIQALDRIKKGELKAERCEKCTYCKITRKAKVISYNILDEYIGGILDG